MIEVDGVIGYQPTTVAPPYRAPSAAAVLPSMMTASPTRSLCRTLSRQVSGKWPRA